VDAAREVFIVSLFFVPLIYVKQFKPSEKTNVCLAWEGVNKVKREKSFCQYWRLLVIATRDIMPFDQLIRPP
jgi:hypothetical protein